MVIFLIFSVPMSEFKVSVIIPVYNAEKYLRNAVESAVALEEVGEIILIEDRSPDNAFQICLQLEKQYEKVTVYTHPNRDNRGAGESRNLGISKSSFEYIAFLDADDWYLPHRFKRCKELLLNNEFNDGVYEATGYYYEATQQQDSSRLTTIKNDISPSNLLFTLLGTEGGRFHTNAITLRKSILEKSGLFDTSLRLHQDTHLWLRIAHVGVLVAGEATKAVAVRRVHDQNRIQHFNEKSRKLLFIKTFEWFEKQNNVSKKSYRIIFNRYAASLNENLFTRLLFTLLYLARHPRNFKKLI